MFRKIDIFLYSILSLVFAFGLYFAFTDLIYFNEVFTVEDGIIEYATAFALLCISLLCFYRLITVGKAKPLLWKISVFVFTVIFIFGAGEEISWGQRIFNIESSDFFLENNAQSETNLHNLVVGGKKLNKIIFSQLLTLVLVLYLLVIPLLYRRKNWVKNLMNTFAVPMVKWHHTLAFLLVTLLVVINPSDRKWELYEFAFGIIFFLIFLYPLNKFIFKKEV